MTSSDWTYHTPRYAGDAPEGLSPGLPAEGWVVEYACPGADPKDDNSWAGGGSYSYRPLHRYRYKRPAAPRQVTLPEDQNERNQMRLFDGFMAYFPNAMAEVAKLSYAATQQHHPDQPMHWDRSKSLDHLNKIGRHMIDAGKLDDKGQRHSAALAWRAMANLQEELERDLGLPPSPASRNRPF